MKNNIDLTQERIFSRRTPIFLLGSLYKIPWRDTMMLIKYSSVDYSSIPENEKIIATGNKDDRINHRLIVEEMYELSVRCVRCGSLNKTRWNPYVGNLCVRCNADLNQQYQNRKPWTK